MTQAKSLLEVKDGLTLPRRHRPPGARRCARGYGVRLPLVLMNSLRARATTRWRRSRGYAELRVRRPARLRPEQGAEAPRRRPARRSTWPRRPGARVVPARPRRPLHRRSSTSGMLDAAARARLRATRSCRTPTTSARCSTRASSPGCAREEIPFLMEVADRTEADRKGGHLARAPVRRPARAARDRADARRGPRRVPGHRRATATSTRTTCGSTCARCSAVMRERDGVLGPADDRQPQDRRPERQVDSPGGLPARDRDGRGDRGVRRRAGAARAARRASRRSRRPTTCSSLRSDAYVLDRRRARRARAERDGRRRRSSRSTPTTSSCLRDFDARFPRGRAVAGGRRAAGGRGRRAFGARRRRARRGRRWRGRRRWTTGRFWRAEGGEVLRSCALTPDMRELVTTDGELAALATRQYGVVARRQLGARPTRSRPALLGEAVPDPPRRVRRGSSRPGAGGAVAGGGPGVR